MSDVISVLSDTIFVSLVNTTWQITLLIPLVVLLIWMFRVKSAATRYSLWLFVLFAIIALPLITPFIPQIDMAQFRSQRTTGDRPDDLVRLGMGSGEAGEVPEDGNSVPPVGAATVQADRGADISLINPVSIAYFIWCAGALLTFCITLGAHINLRRLRVNSPDVKDPAALEMLSRLKQRVRVRRPVALKVSSQIYTPMSLGIFSPTIILPDGVLDSSPFANGRVSFSPFANERASFSPFPKGGSRGISELEMILTHELAHIRRCDYLVNILQNVLKAIFFFHPLYHLMNRSLAKEREHICDDWVIHVTEQRSGYAECIIGLLERALHKPVNVPVTLAMAERRRDIPGRIDMIVNKKRNITTKASTKALIAVFLIGCLALPIMGGVGLIRFAGARAASDEGWIAFNRAENIWVMDADGDNEKQLTFGHTDAQPAWSPDGTLIAFCRYIYGGPNLGDIYVMDADGGNIKRLTKGPENDQGPTWSPDGKRIAFGRGIWEEKDGSWDHKSWAIYVMNADGSNLRILGEVIPCRKVGNWTSSGGCPAWSPDGSQIAYYDWPADRPAVCVMDANGENRKTLYWWGGDMGIDWSPNGDKIVFGSCQDSWNNWQSNDLFVMNADGKELKRLTQPGPAWYEAPAWSPDGARIVFSSWEGRNPAGIYVMNADGSNVRRLINTREMESGPDWTASSYAAEPAGKLKSTWGKIKVLIRPH